MKNIQENDINKNAGKIGIHKIGIGVLIMDLNSKFD